MDINHFKDDLNLLIFNAECRVNLSSVLNNLIQERVVDHIDDDSPRTKASKRIDAKLLALYRLVATEIVCGVFVKDTDVASWFSRYGSFKKGSLTGREFLAAV